MNNKTQNHCPDPGPWLEPVTGIAKEAGDRILEVYETDFTVQQKDDKSPLTAADLAANQAIVSGLAELTPEIPVLSEESAAVPFEERGGWHCYWLIDPLDGTREFVKRNGEFTVNIALIQGHRPVMGVVYVPVTGLTYYACQGMGAHKREPGKNDQRIHVCKLTDGPIVVAGSRSHRGDSLNRFLANIGEHEIISMGSSLKICLVAEGKADVYARLGLTSEWDTAAAHCVVEEAGGFVTELTMQPLRYNTKESILNPQFFVFGDDSRDWSQYL